MTWKNITLEQFLQIQDILENGENVYIKIATLLTGKDQNEVPILEVRKNVDNLKFIKEIIPTERIKSKYTINGVDYELTDDLNKITTAQYLDYLTYSKENKIENTAKLLACFLIPKGKKYNTDYNKMQVVEAIEKHLDIVTVNSIAFFLLKQSKKYILRTVGYLMKQTKKKNNNKTHTHLQTLYKVMG